MNGSLSRFHLPLFLKMAGISLFLVFVLLFRCSHVAADPSIYEDVLPKFGLDYLSLNDAGFLTEINQQVTLEKEGDKTAVTMSIDWGYADENRFSFGYRINGIPPLPNAARIMGNIEIKDQDGVSFAHMGFSEAAWNPVNSDEIIGFWHTAVQPGMPPWGEPPFTMKITLEGRKTVTSDGPIPFAVFEPQSLAVTDNAPTLLAETIGPFVFTLDLPVYSLERHVLGLVSESGDTAVRLVQAETTPAETILSFCYVKPSPGDWMLSGWAGEGVVLQVGSKNAPHTQYQLLRDPDFKMKGAEIPFASAADERCVALKFGLGKLESPQHYELQIDEMMLSLPEVIPEDQIEIATERMAEEGITVEFEYYKDPAGGGGGGWTFSQLPAGMTDMEATRKMLEALNYFHKGPWQFSFNLP